VGTPRRAHATAWLAPLPPGAVKKLCPVRVSPGEGSRGTRATKSMLMLPKTTMAICLPYAVWIEIFTR
jgi:hypothetical protein